MKKNDVEIGATFVAKVSGKLARVRIEGESPYGGWDAKNIDTGRRVRIKSAQRLRRPAKEPHPERDYTTLAEFFPVSMGRPKTATPARSEASAAADQPLTQRSERSSAIAPRLASQADARCVKGQENARLRGERERSPDGMTASERAMTQSAAEGVATPSATTPPEDLPDGETCDAAYDPDVCATVGCGRPSALTYLGRPLCQKCYEDEVADGDLPDRQASETSETQSHEEMNMATKNTKTNKKSATKTTKAPKAAKPKAPKPAGEPKAERKAAADAKPKRLSALDAAAQVLAQAGKPMRAQELIAAMAEQGLWTSPNGKTPEATLYAAMLREARDKGDQARFRKADRGLFEYAG